jgi:hypothetical protein
MVKILSEVRGFSLFSLVRFRGKTLKHSTKANFRQINPFTKGNTYWLSFFFEAFLNPKLTFTTSKNLLIMAKNQTLAKPVAFIGEEIGYELGHQMISDYRSANPTDVFFYEIGRNIIDQVLAQPGCAGIRFYNAYNEVGEKTLVYVGLNSEGKAIVEYTVVNNEGVLESNKGIVADRIKTGDGSPITTSDSEDWNWTID